jgi:hypothetical protein
MIKRKSSTVVVDKESEKEHMANLLSGLKTTVWSENCGSYYQDHRGVVTALIPQSGFGLWKLTRNPNFDHFIFK